MGGMILARVRNSLKPLKDFFLMWATFKVFIEFVTMLLLFMFCVFDHEGCGILAPQPGF